MIFGRWPSGEILVLEKVTYDSKKKLIRVRAWGIDTIQDWLSSREQVVQLDDEHRAIKLLVDVREQESAPSSTDIFDFGKNWPPEIRTVILVGKKTRAEQQFLETVAFNRAKQMRVFDDEVDALNWLGE